MKNAIKLFILLVTGFISFVVEAQDHLHLDFSIPYGNNKTVGKYVSINGANIYYEEYGNGEPLFLIHGNGGNIFSMGNQIDFFKEKYRIIVADSRGQGGLN